MKAKITDIFGGREHEKAYPDELSARTISQNAEKSKKALTKDIKINKIDKAFNFEKLAIGGNIQ